MNILCLDSSTNNASVSLFKNSTLLSEKSSSVLRSHSEFINTAFRQIELETNISPKQIDLICVGVGPGSFTGIRVALSLAKTLSYLEKIPICAFNSLEILNAQSIDAADYSLVLLNAHKNQAYTGLFQNGVPLKNPSAVSFSRLTDHLDLPVNASISVIGDCWDLCSGFLNKKFTSIKRDSSSRHLPDSKSMMSLLANLNWQPKTLDWNTVFPLYIRASEAEENLVK